MTNILPKILHPKYQISKPSEHPNIRGPKSLKIAMIIGIKKHNTTTTIANIIIAINASIFHKSNRCLTL